MGIKQIIFDLFRSIERPTMPINGSEVMRLFNSPSKSGVEVNEKTALRSVAVFACVRILAETPASLPLIIYQRKRGGGKVRATDHPTYSVLHDMANPEMTAMTLRETIQSHAVTYGNGYAYIVRENGWVTELWPLLPDKTIPERVKGELVYKVELPNGEKRKLKAIDVLHVSGLGFDGLRGYSPIALAREAIGLGLAAEEFGARFFGAGTNLGGVVEHPGKLGQQAHENLKNSINQNYQGLGKSHLLLILEEGMKYQKFGVPPNEAQFIETRKMQVTEIARLFRIPPHMIADLERSTFGNIEHQSIDFVVHTLRPWLVRWEQAINYKLFTPSERKEYFVEHLVDGLLRGDSKTRAEALATLRQNGIINADEWRAIENMNPQPDGTGKIYLVNGNMLPVNYVSEKKQEPAARSETKRDIESRSANKRLRLARSYRAIFQDAAERIVRREKADITKIGFKLLGQRNIPQFERWIDDYYADSQAWISRIISPVMRSYADAVQADAANDVNAREGITPEIDEATTNYINSFIVRYTGSSAGQLRQLIRRATEENLDIAETITQRLDEWEERRPEKVATNEPIQQGNTIARAVFLAAGVTTLIWRNAGSKTCAICAEMDGKVVGISRPFVDDATVLESEKQGEMKLNRPAFHPPLHQACVCQIVPG